jgi:glycosyltransferase involved in cell wall biosynthesis
MAPMTSLTVLPSPAAERPGRRHAVASHLRLDGVTVVLPCHDEEPNVAAAVAQALHAGERCAVAVQVVVVDDGSRDATREIAEQLARADQRVQVVVHETNRGYGAALRSGIDASTQPWVLLTDADLQFDLDELEDMLPIARTHDFVAGYRILRSDAWPRRAAAAGWNWLMRRTFHIPVRDVDCAFKLIDGPALRRLELRSDGAMISTELYARAVELGWRIGSVGVHHHPRVAGKASGGDPAVVVRAFRERRELRRTLAAERRAAAAPRGTGAPTPALPDGGAGPLGL